MDTRLKKDKMDKIDQIYKQGNYDSVGIDEIVKAQCALIFTDRNGIKIKQVKCKTGKNVKIHH